MPIKNLSSFSSHWLVLGILAALAMGLPLLNAWLGFPIPVGFNAQYSALGGVLPYSDANDYFGGGHCFNDIGYLDSWNMRRPLNALFFAFRLNITNYNFWYTMLFQTTLCIVALLIYLRTIQRNLGTSSTLFSLIFIFYYAQMFAHSTLSEALGLTLGFLSFVLLWNGWFQRNHLIFNAGMASLAIALSARAGPNFMVFGLLFLIYLEPFTSSRFKDLSGSILSFAIPFVIMAKLSSFFGDSSGGGMPFSNFGTTLYGLVSGGKGWTYAYDDPLTQNIISGKSEAQQAAILYQESWKAFKNNPYNLIRGLTKNLYAFFYIFTEKLAFGAGIIKIIITFILGIFWFIIGFGIYKKRHILRREFLFLTLVFLSIIASACVTCVDGGIRPFAVAIPFMGALLGFSFSVASSAHLQKRKIPENMWAICLVSFIVLSSVLTPYMFSRRKTPDISALRADQIADQKSFLIYNPNKQPHILIDSSPGLHFRTIAPDKLKASGFIYDALGEELKKILDENSSYKFALLNVYDYISHSTKYIIAPIDILESQDEWLLLQVTTTNEKTKIFYKVNSFSGLSQK